MQQLENKIDLMDDKSLNIELKNKGLPTYGSRSEKLKRLKKACNITQESNSPNKKLYF